MPPRRNQRQRAKSVPPTKKSKETKRTAAPKQPVPNATSSSKTKAINAPTKSVPRSSSKIKEERPRRSSRIQKLTDPKTASPIFEELPNIKTNKKSRVNQRQPTQATVKAAKSSKRPAAVAIPASTRPRSPLHTPPVPSWLENIDLALGGPPQVSDPVDLLDTTVPEDFLENMPEDASSLSGVPILVSESATQKTARPKLSPEKFRKLLKLRNAFPIKSSKDDLMKHFLSVFKILKSSFITSNATDELREAFFNLVDECRRSFSEEASSEQDVELSIERMTDELQKWRTMIGLATITDTAFNSDLMHCQDTLSNEAELQRTILPEILSRHQVREMFKFRFEGQWKSQGKSALPSTDPMDNGIPAPKPDLAVFFNREALGSSSAPIPHDIEISLRPEGYEPLCFPFLFIEAKKQSDTLVPALDKNLYSANQALFNIYRWMEKAGDLENFFLNIRTFSISINAQEIIARVHRAELSTGRLPLSYAYDDLTTLSRYTKNSACKLIRSILLEYGAKELHEILKTTFQFVSDQYAEGNYLADEPLNTARPSPKRKNDVTSPTSPSKRPQTRSQINRPINLLNSDANASFGASGISLN